MTTVTAPQAPGVPVDAPAGATPLVVLTDEELAALDPASPDERLVVLPQVDGLTKAERDLVVAAALRGLVARGWVSPTDPAEIEQAAAAGDQPVTVTLRLAEHLATTLQLRASARRAVVAQRLTAQRQDSLYLYDVTDELSLVELVEPTGLHHFALTTPAGSVSALLEYFARPQWQGEEGPTLTVPIEEALLGQVSAPVADALGEAYVQGAFVIRRPGPPDPTTPLFAVHAGPQGLLVGRFEPGDPGAVRLERVTRTGLLSWVEEQLT